MSPNEPTFTQGMRERAERVRDAFANYTDGTGLDAHAMAIAMLAILDERAIAAGPPPAEVSETSVAQVIAAFDALAQRRARELLTYRSKSPPVNRMLETAFCLGYKAGAIDANQAVVDAKQAARLQAQESEP